MKAEGSAQNLDAQYVRAMCIKSSDEVGLVELITPKVCYAFAARCVVTQYDIGSE